MPVDPLIGTWRVIDDRTGYYVSEIVIRKHSKNQQYSAVVTKTRQIPGVENPELCGKCIGQLKDQPIFGMEVLKGAILDSNSNRLSKGIWLNTQDGRSYDIHGQLSSSQKQLKVSGDAKSSNLTSSMTWLKQ